MEARFGAGDIPLVGGQNGMSRWCWRCDGTKTLGTGIGDHGATVVDIRGRAIGDRHRLPG